MNDQPVPPNTQAPQIPSVQPEPEPQNIFVSTQNSSQPLSTQNVSVPPTTFDVSQPQAGSSTPGNPPVEAVPTLSSIPADPNPQPAVTMPSMDTPTQNIVTTDADFAPPPPMPGGADFAPPPPMPIGTPAPTNSPTGETPPSGGNVIEPKKKASFKTLGIVLASLMLIGLLVFAVINFVLPMLTGNGGTGTGKEVTLTWWGLWEDQSVVAPLISEYQQKNPNVKINYVKQSQQDYRERLTNAMAKGTGPDIFRFHNSWVPMFKNELDLVPTSVMSGSAFQEAYYPVMVSDLALGTGFAGLPMEYDGLALYVNEELFNTAGKTVPTTWDELRQTAIDLTIKDENGTITQSGIPLGRTENVDHWPEILALMMMQNGVKMTNPTGENAETALAFFSIFSSQDGVWDETLPTSTIAFSSGKAAMYIAPSWRVFEVKQQNPELKFKVYPVPQLPKEDTGEPDMTYATYWVEGVWKRSKNKEAAWEFTKFLASKETLQKFYTSASKVRAFGEPYPRRDMASLVSSDPLVSAFVNQAPNATSWYLQSRTFDGPTGINTQVTKYFEDAINAVNAGTRPVDALKTVSQGVNQVLSNYGQ